MKDNIYLSKFESAIQNTFYKNLPIEEQEFIKEKAFVLKFSHQELKQIIDIARDLEMWDEKHLKDIFPDHQQKKVVFTRLKKAYVTIRDRPNSYDNFELKNIPKEQKFTFKVAEKQGFGLGLCPVASEKTRCCNLLTLDAENLADLIVLTVLSKVFIIKTVLPLIVVLQKNF